MTIRQAIKRAVLERQGGLCVGRPARKGGEACGQDLVALRKATHLHKYLPKGRTAVEFDHVVPREQGGSDDPENLQALCGWCHHEKTELERPGWEAPSPSVFAERGVKPRAAHRPADKALRLRCGAPVKNYSAGVDCV